MTMRMLGGWLIAFGLFSVLISFVGLRFKILWFLDEFGPVAGYALKAGLFVLGVWLWRNGDREMTSEDAEIVEGRRGWMPLVVIGVFLLGLGGFAGFKVFKNYQLNRQLNQPAPAAEWVSKPVDQWPPLVLLQKAEFKNHSDMEAGCASLVQLPSGDVVALTAGHLLGRDGGVEPGFLRGLGDLDHGKLAGLTDEIVSWDLYLPGQPQPMVEVTGLFGKAKELKEDCDQLLLSVSPPAATSPLKPIGIRLSPVTFQEPLQVIACELDADGKPRQVVHKARRMPGVYGLACELEKPARLDGCSGAPVVDTNGLVVGIVTGGTPRDLGNSSDRVTSFSGHSIAELMPVIKSAVARGGATKVAARSSK